MDALNALSAEIDAQFEKKSRLLVAIDGMCAAGKSMLADALAARYDANVYRMDDFFLPAERKTATRLAEAGGNVDYERFFGEVLSPLLRAEEVGYRRFDCREGAYLPPRLVAPRPLEIVEGVYSTHPAFGQPYDLTAFLAIAPEAQRARIKARNGDEMLARFEREWIPLEHAYFDRTNARGRSMLVIAN